MSSDSFAKILPAIWTEGEALRVEEEEVVGAQADTGRHGQCMVTQALGRDRRYQGASEGVG